MKANKEIFYSPNDFLDNAKYSDVANMFRSITKTSILYQDKSFSGSMRYFNFFINSKNKSETNPKLFKKGFNLFIKELKRDNVRGFINRKINNNGSWYSYITVILNDFVNYVANEHSESSKGMYEKEINVDYDTFYFDYITLIVFVVISIMEDNLNSISGNQIVDGDSLDDYCLSYETHKMLSLIERLIGLRLGYSFLANSKNYKAGTKSIEAGEKSKKESTKPLHDAFIKETAKDEYDKRLKEYKNTGKKITVKEVSDIVYKKYQENKRFKKEKYKKRTVLAKVTEVIRKYRVNS